MKHVSAAMVVGLIIRSPPLMYAPPEAPESLLSNLLWLVGEYFYNFPQCLISFGQVIRGNNCQASWVLVSIQEYLHLIHDRCDFRSWRSCRDDFNSARWFYLINIIAVLLDSRHMVRLDTLCFGCFGGFNGGLCYFECIQQAWQGFNMAFRLTYVLGNQRRLFPSWLLSDS